MMIYTTSNQQIPSVFAHPIATVSTDHFAPIKVRQFLVFLREYEYFLQGDTSREALSLELSNLYHDKYVVKQPIPVKLYLNDEGEFIASIEEANIAMTGLFAADAIRLLREHVAELYAILLNERLGPEPQKQLDKLEKYIGEKSTQ